MDVVPELGTVRYVIVDDHRQLLHIDSTSQDISVSGDKNLRVALLEVLHHAVLLVLWHPPIHAGNSELGLMHLVSEPVNIVGGIAENKCLTDGCRLKDIKKGVKLQLFLFNINKKFFDAVIAIVLSVHIDCE